MKKMGASKHRRLKASPKGAQSHPRARRITTYYVGNVSAEMATVLRKDANILIRLREKMEVQTLAKFGQICEILGKKQQKIQRFLTEILRLESGAKECIV